MSKINQTFVFSGTKRHRQSICFTRRSSACSRLVSLLTCVSSAAHSDMTPLTLVSHLITLCFLLLCFRSWRGDPKMSASVPSEGRTAWVSSSSSSHADLFFLCLRFNSQNQSGGWNERFCWRGSRVSSLTDVMKERRCFLFSSLMLEIKSGSSHSFSLMLRMFHLVQIRCYHHYHINETVTPSVCVSGRVLQLRQSVGASKRRDAVRLRDQRLQPHLQELQGTTHLSDLSPVHHPADTCVLRASVKALWGCSAPETLNLKNPLYFLHVFIH